MAQGAPTTQPGEMAGTKGCGWFEPLNDLVATSKNSVLGSLQASAAQKLWPSTEHKQLIA